MRGFGIWTCLLLGFLQNCASRRTPSSLSNNEKNFEESSIQTAQVIDEVCNTNLELIVDAINDSDFENQILAIGLILQKMNYKNEAQNPVLLREITQALLAPSETSPKGLNTQKVSAKTLVSLFAKTLGAIESFSEKPSLVEIALQVQMSAGSLKAVLPFNETLDSYVLKNEKWVLKLTQMPPDKFSGIAETFDQAEKWKTEGILENRKDTLFLAAQITGLDMDLQKELFPKNGPFTPLPNSSTSLPSRSEHKRFVAQTKSDLDSTKHLLDTFFQGGRDSQSYNHEYLTLPLSKKLDGLDGILARSLQILALYPRPEFSEIPSAGKEQIVEIAQLGEDLVTELKEQLLRIIEDSTRIKNSWGQDPDFAGTGLPFLESLGLRLERLAKLKTYFESMKFIQTR